jgi:DHA1 family bicyclomycin/chloramphenicol resistance-like MFS transporter
MTLLVLILGLLTAFGSLSIDMYLPAFPAIARDLATDPAAVEASLALFFLGFSVGQMLYGPISDRFGRKPPLYFGLALYTAASIGCALAWSIEALIGFRFLQALGGCAGIVVSRAVVRDRFDHNEAAHMFSLLMLVMGVAPILAPLAGGYLATGLGWRAIFMLLAAIGIAAAILVHLRLDETLDPSRATATIRPGAILRNYVIVLRDRHFLRYTLSNSCALAGMFAYISGSPFVLIDLYGVSPEHYGLYFGANAFGLIGLSQFNRRLLRRFSFEAILPAAFGAMMACGLFVMIAGTLHLPLAWFAAGLFLFVSGLGLVGPNSAAGAPGGGRVDVVAVGLQDRPRLRAHRLGGMPQGGVLGRARRLRQHTSRGARLAAQSRHQGVQVGVVVVKLRDAHLSFSPAGRSMERATGRVRETNSLAVGTKAPERWRISIGEGQRSLCSRARPLATGSNVAPAATVRGLSSMKIAKAITAESPMIQVIGRAVPSWNALTRPLAAAATENCSVP